MHKTDCIWTEPDRCNCGWLQEIAKNPRRVDDEIERLRAELAACRAAAVYLFNCGYMRGHHDTVEACFVDIHDSDMRTYQSDVVAEVIDEALTARKGEGDG